MDPIFSAVSSSAKQLWQLLRCIGFSNKATVLITSHGIKITAEEPHLMQGMILLDRTLFTTYAINSTLNQVSQSEDDEDAEVPPFEISLSALLQTLQIFGINDIANKESWTSRNGFHGSSRDHGSVLGMTGICRLSYRAVGDPLLVTLEEAGVTTTAELTTYEPSLPAEIPFLKDQVAQKIIMRANWLHDAVLEIESTFPQRVTMASSPQAPYFTLSSNGPLGSATVEFSRDPQLLETFQVTRRTSNVYKYSIIKAATRAMSAAVKVSIRTDLQGTLNLQCMVPTEQEAQQEGHTFVDFRFVAYADEEDEDEDDDTGAMGSGQTD